MQKTARSRASSRIEWKMRGGLRFCARALRVLGREYPLSGRQAQIGLSGCAHPHAAETRWAVFWGRSQNLANDEMETQEMVRTGV